MQCALTIAALAAAAIPLAGCGKEDAAEQAEPADRTAGGLPPSGTAAGFVTRLAVTDLYEVAAGRLALERATTPAVRRFAETMVADHQRTSAGLQAELARLKLNVRPPAEPDARRRELLADLRAAPAAEFEDRYIDQQMEAHDNASFLLQEFAENGEPASLKEWARRTAPVIENHRQMAYALDRVDTGRSAQGGAAGGQRR